MVAGLSCVPLAAIQLSAKLIKIRPYLPPMYLFGWGVVLMSLVLWSFRPYKSVRRAIAPALSVFTLAYLVILQLPRITNYPFSLDWSEGSRIYEASQMYSLLVYGIQLPLPLLDAGRAILQGIPFTAGAADRGASLLVAGPGIGNGAGYCLAVGATIAIAQ
jgi:hypothetical protein